LKKQILIIFGRVALVILLIAENVVLLVQEGSREAQGYEETRGSLVNMVIGVTWDPMDSLVP
jgi:hypothetical protein